MEKHKKKALETDCLCSKCIFRFQCFTQERVFSDPIYQGLFEALMAQGKSKEEALDEVANEIKLRMNRFDLQPFEPVIQPYTIPYPNSAPDVQPYVQPWTVISDSISFDANDKGEVLVSYTMHDGKEVSWILQ
uniref:Uncharacterized protein n=1 Tax=viral metagenome TaxID=1070528 RepID=A0A6M3JRI4_9ZZZZ